MVNKPFIPGLIVLGLCSCQWAGSAPTSPTETRNPITAETSTPLPTETTTPTPTPEPLSEQLGFSDEAIQDIQDKYTGCSLAGQRETQIGNKNYTAYLIACDSTTFLRVYERGIQESQNSSEAVFSTSFLLICFDCGAVPDENWQDVDKDGLPDLVVGMGTNYYFHNYVFRMTKEGKMENLLDACPFKEQGLLHPSFEDIIWDGTLELIATDIRWDYDKSDIGFYMPGIPRVFELQDCEFQDVSASYPDFYEPTINAFLRNCDYIRSTGGYNTQIAVLVAFEGLLACDIVGRREECWPIFWEFTDLERFPLESMAPGPPPDSTPSAENFEFMDWLNQKRTILAQQYKEGLPFSPEAP
jgi:hypothetical protein